MMSKRCRLVVLVLLCVASLNGYSNVPQDTAISPVRKGYKKLMKRAFLDLSNGYGISDSILTLLIPESKEEYLYFDSLSSPNDSFPALSTGSKVYKSLLSQKLKPQDNLLYRKYLFLSEYAEGNYAITYYNLLEKILAEDMPLFCTFFRREKSPRLSHLQRYADTCK